MTNYCFFILQVAFLALFISYTYFSQAALIFLAEQSLSEEKTFVVNALGKYLLQGTEKVLPSPHTPSNKLAHKALFFTDRAYSCL